MMHGHEKSDLVIVAMKPANKAREAHRGGVCGGGRSGVGGAKGGGQGEYAPAKHALDSEPGSRVTGAGGVNVIEPRAYPADPTACKAVADSVAPVRFSASPSSSPPLLAGACARESAPILTRILFHRFLRPTPRRLSRKFPGVPNSARAWAGARCRATRAIYGEPIPWPGVRVAPGAKARTPMSRLLATSCYAAFFVQGKLMLVEGQARRRNGRPFAAGSVRSMLT